MKFPFPFSIFPLSSSSPPSHRHRRRFIARPASTWVAAVLLGWVALPVMAQATAGTFQHLFAASSMWNSRPFRPVLGTFVIPKSAYFPAVAEGAWSSGVFQARPDDPAVVVVGPVGKAGVWDPDSEAFRPSIKVPHWPASVMPASAADGHADIVDEAAGVVHSFWQLRNDNGTWRATQYAWAPLAGSGWGDPAHYFQGARAAGVPTSAGLIRKHELNDGDTQYRHALAMSLTFNALSGNPAYVFPATSADSGAATQNSGQVPEGTLLMLPGTFDTRTLTNAAIRKVAETLKTYGAYVVDRNVGTPFVIYVENGAGFNLHPTGWNGTAANELDAIRRELRPVVSAAAWRDMNGNYFTPDRRGNLLSMRGGWRLRSGDAVGSFDTWQQALVIPASSQASELVNLSNRNVSQVQWAKPTAGNRYRLTAHVTGGARLKLEVIDKATGQVAYASGYLANGVSADFSWPSANTATALTVKTVAGAAAQVSATLQPLP